MTEDGKLGIIPNYSLAKGFLTGKYRPGSQVDSPRAEAAGSYVNERGNRVLSALELVAKRHGSAPASVALAWLAARPAVTAPIASARNTEQLRDLLAHVNVLKMMWNCWITRRIGLLFNAVPIPTSGEWFTAGHILETTNWDVPPQPERARRRSARPAP